MERPCSLELLAMGTCIDLRRLTAVEPIWSSTVSQCKIDALASVVAVGAKIDMKATIRSLTLVLCSRSRCGADDDGQEGGD
jgi:hypothetical protein